jgi:manganese efflux pump family protein
MELMMDFFTMVMIAVGLAMDAFAVSLGIGTSRQASSVGAKLRLAFHFGFFQFAMPIVGWLAGSTVERFISQFDHWIALILLAYVGVNMIRSGFNPEQESYSNDPSRGKTLVVLAVATSIDALAVGLSLAMLNVQVFTPSLVIGVVTFGLSIVGLLAGNRLGEKFGKRMEIIGGLILIGIGLRILISHLMV